MRPLIALLLSAAILLGVRGYLHFAESLRVASPPAVVEQAAEGTFSADITLTFDAAADSFSLEPVSLVLKQQDRVLLERRDRVAAGESLLIETIDGIVAGPNEFYFEAVPADTSSMVARAVRIRIYRDGMTVADTTLWSEPGQTPRGKIVVDVPPSRPAAGGHDHAS